MSIVERERERIAYSFGEPKAWTSDGGTHFTAQVMQMVSSRLGMVHYVGVTNASWSYGVVKRMNHVLEIYVLGDLSVRCSAVQRSRGVENRSHLTVRRNASKSDGFRFGEMVWSLALVEQPPLVHNFPGTRSQLRRDQSIHFGIILSPGQDFPRSSRAYNHIH